MALLAAPAGAELASTVLLFRSQSLVRRSAPARRRGSALQGRSFLQDARYVIDTITFFAVSCPENFAFFRKNRQFFEKIPRKILKLFEKLGHKKSAEFVVLEIPKKFGSIWRKFSKILANFAKFWKKSKKFSNFQRKF